MVPWRLGILSFAHSLVQLPIVVAFKDSAIAVERDHLRRVSSQEAENDTSEHESKDSSIDDYIQAEMLKRASATPEDSEYGPFGRKKEKKGPGGSSGNKFKDSNKREARYDGEYWDEFEKTLYKKNSQQASNKKVKGKMKNVQEVVAGNHEQILDSNPRAEFHALFNRPQTEDGPAGLQSHNLFIQDVCTHNPRLSKPIVRLKVVVFEAWLKFTGATMEEKCKKESEGKVDLKKEKEKPKTKWTCEYTSAPRDISQFKWVMYHYRHDIAKAVEGEGPITDKKKLKQMDVLEKSFDHHLIKCWEVARAMNPAARQKALKLNNTLKEDWKVMPWIRMHEFAYIFILAFGYAGLPKDKNHWYNADWLDLMSWRNFKDARTEAGERRLRHENSDIEAQRAKSDKAIPSVRDMWTRYSPHYNSFEKPVGLNHSGTKMRHETDYRRFYNWDLQDKWSQQLAADRSSTTSAYVDLLHVTFFKGLGSCRNEEPKTGFKVATSRGWRGHRQWIYVSSIKKGGIAAKAGVKQNMLPVAVNGVSFDNPKAFRSTKTTIKEKYDELLDNALRDQNTDEYTITFLVKGEQLDLYNMEELNGADPTRRSYRGGMTDSLLKMDIDDQYVRFPFVVQGYNKYTGHVDSHSPKVMEDRGGGFQRREARGPWENHFQVRKFPLFKGYSLPGKAFPDKGFDDPPGVLDFRDAGNAVKKNQEAWWLKKDDEGKLRFTRETDYWKIKKRPDHIGPFIQITEEMFLQHFMRQRLDMFTNLADSSLLNDATTSEPFEPDESMEKWNVSLGYLDKELSKADVDIGEAKERCKNMIKCAGFYYKGTKDASRDEVRTIHFCADRTVKPNAKYIGRTYTSWTLLDDSEDIVIKDIQDRPMRLNSAHHQVITSNEAALKAYVVKDLRGRTRLYKNAYRYSMNRLDKNEVQYRIMHHLRAQYSWRSERDENLLRAQMRERIQLEEYRDYKEFLQAVFEAAKTMIPFVRLGYWWHTNTNFRGDFIADPAFHYAGIIAQEFCWRHVREVKGTIYPARFSGKWIKHKRVQTSGKKFKEYQQADQGEPYSQFFGRDVFMLIPLELPKSMQSSFEVRTMFEPDQAFESFAGQKVRKHGEVNGEEVYLREPPFSEEYETVYRVPGQLLKDLPEPHIDPRSNWEDRSDQEKGYGSGANAFSNWNDIAIAHLDKVFGGRNGWKDLRIGDLDFMHSPKVSKIMTDYLDRLDDKAVEKIRAEEDAMNGTAFDDDPDEVRTAQRP